MAFTSDQIEHKVQDVPNNNMTFLSVPPRSRQRLPQCPSLLPRACRGRRSREEQPGAGAGVPQAAGAKEVQGAAGGGVCAGAAGVRGEGRTGS